MFPHPPPEICYSFTEYKILKYALLTFKLHRLNSDSGNKYKYLDSKSPIQFETFETFEGKHKRTKTCSISQKKGDKIYIDTFLQSLQD